MAAKIYLVLVLVASVGYLSAARRAGPGMATLREAAPNEFPVELTRSLLMAPNVPNLNPTQPIEVRPFFPQPLPQPFPPLFPEPRPQPQPQPFPKPQPQPFPQPQPPRPPSTVLCPPGEFIAFGPQGEVCFPEGILLPTDHSLFPPRDPASVQFCPAGELYRPLSNGFYGCIAESVVYAQMPQAPSPSPAPAGGE